jgi:hypothetical protein
VAPRGAWSNAANPVGAAGSACRRGGGREVRVDRSQVLQDPRRQVVARDRDRPCRRGFARDGVKDSEAEPLSRRAG